MVGDFDVKGRCSLPLVGGIKGHDNENTISIGKGAVVGATAGFMVGESLGIIGMSVFEFKIPKLTLVGTGLGGGTMLFYSLYKSPDSSSVSLMRSTALGMTAGLMLGLPIDYLT